MTDETNLNPLSTAEVITMPKEEALEKFKEYSVAVKRSHSAMDRLMVQTFRALSRGLGVINVPEAIKKAGVTGDYKPKLAVMRADQSMVHFHRASAGAGRYSFSERYYLTRHSRKAQNARLQFVVPENTFPIPPSFSAQPRDYWWTLSAPVAPIPPAHRPADAYSKYCILWEVERWEAKAPPADPMLLRPLGQTGLYVVVAHWDLTPVERMVLGGLLRQRKEARRMSEDVRTEHSVCAAFNAVVVLALALGVRSIKDLPACWKHQVDEHWFIAINGHDTDQQTSKGNNVPPFHCYIEFNGWPAGLITPDDGIIAAGSLANEDSFIAALEQATTEARREADS